MPAHITRDVSSSSLYRTRHVQQQQKERKRAREDGDDDDSKNCTVHHFGSYRIPTTVSNGRSGLLYHHFDSYSIPTTVDIDRIGLLYPVVTHPVVGRGIQLLYPSDYCIATMVLLQSCRFSFKEPHSGYFSTCLKVDEKCFRLASLKNIKENCNDCKRPLMLIPA